ncbi:hypothetical protein GCM10022415_27230 [Knoellia locipacati]|uniref:Uncharacterized protein n=1 Tax=Knoellia locipacati TaxID=882824 RepID=A0A512T3E2_9MICO|nr:hypothetical protein KLO01_27200 [Knoellia locipacati]
MLLLLGACAASGNESAGTAAGQPNFWPGLWHGLISPITFLVSLFRDDVGIYEVRNSGAWYDFGFMVGVSIAFGSTARAGAGSSRRRETSGKKVVDRG